MTAVPRGVAAFIPAMPLALVLACASGAPAVRAAPAPAVAATSSAGGRESRVVQLTDLGSAPSVERLITGRFSGVTVASGSNGGLRIRIRGGANSFVAGEEPLYIVDGTPLPAGTGEIGWLTADDVDRIEVLKNPADVGLYGVRGGNGVVRITTKQGGRR